MSPSPSSFQGPSKNSRLYAAPLSLSRQWPSHRSQSVSQAYSWIHGCRHEIRWCWIQFVFIRLRLRNNTAAGQVILAHSPTTNITHSQLISDHANESARSLSPFERIGLPLFRPAAGGIPTRPSTPFPVGSIQIFSAPSRASSRYTWQTQVLAHTSGQGANIAPAGQAEGSVCEGH